MWSNASLFLPFPFVAGTDFEKLAFFRASSQYLICLSSSPVVEDEPSLYLCPGYVFPPPI